MLRRATAPTMTIRVVGDPVLRQRATEVTDIDSALVRTTDLMLQAMYDAPGIGLAAPQVGIQKRFFVYDLGDGTGPQVLLNPTITGTDGEWAYLEGCLSIPGLNFEIVRPKHIGVSGLDLDGNPFEFEADELLARLVQHELDHLDGILMLEHLDDEQRREAKREIRLRMMSPPDGPRAAE